MPYARKVAEKDFENKKGILPVGPTPEHLISQFYYYEQTKILPAPKESYFIAAQESFKRAYQFS